MVFPYAVPTVDQYVGPGSIPIYVPSDIFSRAPIIVPGITPSLKTGSLHQLVPISIPTINAIQYPINYNSSFLSAVIIMDCDTIDTSMTQQIIIKESFYNINRNEYIYALQ